MSVVGYKQLVSVSVVSYKTLCTWQTRYNNFPIFWYVTYRRFLNSYQYFGADYSTHLHAHRCDILNTCLYGHCPYCHLLSERPSNIWLSSLTAVFTGTHARTHARTHMNLKDTDAKPNVAQCNGHVRVCSVSQHHFTVMYGDHKYSVYLTATCFDQAWSSPCNSDIWKETTQKVAQNSSCASWLLSVETLRYRSNVMSVGPWGL